MAYICTKTVQNADQMNENERKMNVEGEVWELTKGSGKYKIMCISS